MKRTHSKRLEEASREWLADVPNANTRDVYQRGLQFLADHLRLGSQGRAGAALLRLGRQDARSLAMRLRAKLLSSSSPGTARARLGALRAFTKHARSAGLIEWALEFDPVKHIVGRNTRGPELAVVRKLLASMAKDKTPTGKRDLAMVRLMAHRGLRRGEVASLNLKSVDGDGVWVAGKGKSGQRELLTLAPSTMSALKGWLRMRAQLAPNETALFIRDNGARFDEAAIYRMVRDAGKRIGVKLWPHALRHFAGTEAYRRLKDIRAVQIFMRHASIEMTMVYVQMAEDQGGRVARALAKGS